MHGFQITIVLDETKVLKDRTPWHHGDTCHRAASSLDEDSKAKIGKTLCQLGWWFWASDPLGCKPKNETNGTWRISRVETHPSLSEDYFETYASWWFWNFMVLSTCFTFTKQIESLNQTISPITKPIPKHQNQLHSRMRLAMTQVKWELAQGRHFYEQE